MIIRRTAALKRQIAELRAHNGRLVKQRDGAIALVGAIRDEQLATL